MIFTIFQIVILVQLISSNESLPIPIFSTSGLKNVLFGRVATVLQKMGSINRRGGQNVKGNRTQIRCEVKKKDNGQQLDTKKFDFNNFNIDSKKMFANFQSFNWNMKFLSLIMANSSHPRLYLDNVLQRMANRKKLAIEMERRRRIGDFRYERPNLGQFEYDEELAKRLCVLSGGAYLNVFGDLREAKIKEMIEKIFPAEEKWQFGHYFEDHCHYTGHKEAFFYTHSDETKELILTFRGTTNNFQLLTELFSTFDKKAIFPNHYQIGFTDEKMKVNKYFLAAHKHLWAQVEDILWYYRDYTVTFHGHSLGGALASLAAVGAVESKILKSAQVRHYTFGQPRVGNLEFARHFDELVPNSFRVVSGQDPIAHWPLFDMGEMGSYHHSTEVWYKNGMKDGDFKPCLGQPHNEDPDCSDQYEFDNALAMARFGYEHTANFDWCEQILIY